MFAATTWWQAGLLSISLGLALAGIGFNVTHDANHGSFSRRRWLNRTMRWSLDLMGASSYVWRTKHNVVHHTYTNVSGVDHDIDGMPFARFAPDQPRRWFHRSQHVYMWALYGLFAISWHTTADFGHLRKGEIGGATLRWPRGLEAVGFWGGKALFVGWAVVVPALFHPLWQVAIVFAIVSVVLAFVLAVTFQLAHCLEEAEFTTPDEMTAARPRRLGAPPDRDHGGLRAAQPPARLVPRRAQLPGRAPPVLAGVPCPLPGHGADRPGGLRTPRRQVSQPPHDVLRGGLARPMAATDGGGHEPRLRSRRASARDAGRIRLTLWGAPGFNPSGA